MTPRTVATIIFATVFLIAFAVMSPLIYIARVDARHIERALNERLQNQP
jgi:hypothetical protein